MNLTPLPQKVWARTPPEAQAYSRALEARVGTLEAALQRLEGPVRQLEATVQHVQEQLEQNSRTSSRPPASDPPRPEANGLVESLLGVDRAGNVATKGIAVGWCRSQR
jgi:hypothetical protein